MAFLALPSYMVVCILISNVLLVLFCNSSKFQKFSILTDEKSKLEAEKIDKILQPVHHSMFVESNPSPVKYAAKLLGLCDDEVRLPMVKVTEATKKIVEGALKSAKLI